MSKYSQSHHNSNRDRDYYNAEDEDWEEEVVSGLRRHQHPQHHHISEVGLGSSVGRHPTHSHNHQFEDNIEETISSRSRSHSQSPNPEYNNSHHHYIPSNNNSHSRSHSWRGVRDHEHVHVPQFQMRHQNTHPGHPGNPYQQNQIPEKFRDEKDGSEIYVLDNSAYLKPQPPSVYSHYSGRSRNPSEAPSSVKNKVSRKGGVVVETTAAPNPFCPNTKGVCCLLLLINLGLILITLGFSIVLQLFDPPYIWFFGVAFLIVGFVALLASLVFCVYLCREADEEARNRGVQPGELYWTHHWTKKIGLPSLRRENEKQVDDISTVYSADPDDKYYLRNETNSQRDMIPIHSYHSNPNNHNSGPRH